MQNIVNNFLRDEGAERDGAGFEPGPHEGGTSLWSPFSHSSSSEVESDLSHPKLRERRENISFQKQDETV